MRKSGSRTLGVCPYRDCGFSFLTPTSEGTEKRNPNHQLVKCSGCGCFAIRQPSGMVFPLVDANDPDSESAVTVTE